MPRTKVTVTQGQDVQTYWHDMNERGLPDSLDNVLATAGLISLTEVYEDRTVTYEKPEYECYWCGSYNHTDDECPETHEE